MELSFLPPEHCLSFRWLFFLKLCRLSSVQTSSQPFGHVQTGRLSCKLIRLLAMPILQDGQPNSTIGPSQPAVKFFFQVLFFFCRAGGCKMGGKSWPLMPDSAYNTRCLRQILFFLQIVSSRFTSIFWLLILCVFAHSQWQAAHDRAFCGNSGTSCLHASCGYPEGGGRTKAGNVLAHKFWKTFLQVQSFQSIAARPITRYQFSAAVETPCSAKVA